MNLEAFTMNTPDSEFYRVVRHEAGHTLGFPHEHMRKEIIQRLDREKVIGDFMASQGWTRQEVIDQVLTPLEESSLLATPTAEEDSIMCYEIPGSLTLDGQADRGRHRHHPQRPRVRRAGISQAALAMAGRHHVLLIGIDAYDGGGMLTGCVNDIDAVQRLLLDRVGVPPAHIRRLAAPRTGARARDRRARGAAPARHDAGGAGAPRHR